MIDFFTGSVSEEVLSPRPKLHNTLAPVGKDLSKDDKLYKPLLAPKLIIAEKAMRRSVFLTTWHPSHIGC